MGALAAAAHRAAGHGAGRLRDRRHRRADRPRRRHQRAARSKGLRLYIDRLNAAGGINGKKIKLIMLDDWRRAVEGRRQRQAAADAGQRAAAGPVEPVVDLCAGDRRDQARQRAAAAHGRGLPEGGLSAGRSAASSAPPPMPAATTAAPRSTSSRRRPRSRCGSALPPWRSRSRAARSITPRATPRRWA